MSRQREIPELITLLEKGASVAEVAAYTEKILEWAMAKVMSTKGNGHAWKAGVCDAHDNLQDGLSELRKHVGLED
jgi:hypothetical protein